MVLFTHAFNSFHSVPYEGDFVGQYTGSYRDLKREVLTVRVLDMNCFLVFVASVPIYCIVPNGQILQYELWDPNKQLGKKDVELKDCAEGNVAIEVDVFGGGRCTFFPFFAWSHVTVITWEEKRKWAVPSRVGSGCSVAEVVILIVPIPAHGKPSVVVCCLC
jgi:hypothetical protein